MSFYQGLLGTPANTDLAVDRQVVMQGPVLTIAHKRELLKVVSAEEVLDALKSIGDNKAPGLDGYSARFFKSSWHIVGGDIVAAVQEFFRTGKLLRSLNTSLITLIPKHATVNTIRDYRPIAYCNVLYKIISKLITNRMSVVMSYLVGREQATFVPGDTFMIILCWLRRL